MDDEKMLIWKLTISYGSNNVDNMVKIYNECNDMKIKNNIKEFLKDQIGEMYVRLQVASDALKAMR